MACLLSPTSRKKAVADVVAVAKTVKMACLRSLKTVKMACLRSPTSRKKAVADVAAVAKTVKMACLRSLKTVKMACLLSPTSKKKVVADVAAVEADKDEVLLLLKKHRSLLLFNFPLIFLIDSL